VAVNFIALKSCSVFDSETGESIVTKDIADEKGADDYYISFGLSECSGFYLSEMSHYFIAIDNRDIPVYSTDLSISGRSIKIPVRTQREIPLNEEFFMVVKSKWVNQNSRFEDTEKFVIYRLRFVSTVVVKLKPNRITVLEGETFEVDASDTYISNVKSASDRDDYSFEWECPAQLA